jgi:hypothetical protein
VSLGNSPYLRTLGAGVSLSMPFPGGAVLEPFFEGRQRRFGNTRDYPIADEQTGRLWTTGLLASGPLIGSTVRWQARFSAARNDARLDFDSYNQLALDVGVPIEFDGPWPGSRKWVLTPYAGVATYHYDQPNAIIDPVALRRDREWRVGTVLDAQIFEFAGLGVQVQYSVIDSTIRNYDTKNLSVVFGPTVRF